MHKDVLTPREHIILTRQSETFDLSERYWQFRLVCEALQRTNVSAIQHGNSNIHSEEPTENIAWEPPTEFSGANKSTLNTDLFDPNRNSDLAEVEIFNTVEIDTAEHTSQPSEPTPESLEQVEQQRRILDNREYQRENHAEACRLLKISESGALRMRSMNRTATFKQWQPVAIAAMHEILQKDYIRGVVLGDTVGLGKTWEAVGFLLHVSIHECFSNV